MKDILRNGARTKRLLASHLEESGDGVGRDASVGVGDQILHVEIACSNSVRLGQSEITECTNRREFESGFGRGKEELEDCTEREENMLGQVPIPNSR